MSILKSTVPERLDIRGAAVPFTLLCALIDGDGESGVDEQVTSALVDHGWARREGDTLVGTRALDDFLLTLP